MVIIYIINNFSYYIVFDSEYQMVKIKIINEIILKIEKISTIDFYVLFENKYT